MSSNKIDFCNGPIQRGNSQHNLAFSGKQTLALRGSGDFPQPARIISWSAHDMIPENHTFLLQSVVPSFGEVGVPLEVICKLNWTVQNVKQNAEIDFLRGTKFQLVADSFDLTAQVIKAPGLLNGDVVVSALWSQNALANVNGQAPQRSYTYYADPIGDPVPATVVDVPPFARYVTIQRYPYTTAFRVSQVMDDNVSPVAQTQVGAGSDLTKWQLANSAKAIRWTPTAGSTEFLVINFDIDL